ncbi:4-hydroxybenzoate polyprenyltransferase [Candidatus Terasakiella magnetica]|uniref:4-hydroxybenzoate octaprenyltransferase n=1 Tax=Candidatus Terasakiella magnetica TaxID=1867952 RepID=A0A1C3RIS5_9PROT|nr:4-hydroxybenzoate octaprenyltransferase [Candidatus Terasakiella magnetica]SCA57173.1 4-hydroxybenzoate polyprenyltransferase [Candidatus Terasakiella magnetica]
MENSIASNKTDIVYHGWIARMPAFMRPYLILMRADRPIGTWLLLFPCLWTLSLASEGFPDLYYAALFAIGAFVMRGAGCVMNDLADRDFDGQVTRTATRPIPNGDVSPKQAAIFMGGLCLIGLVVLIQFNSFTVYLASASLLLVFIYPFCKRWTYWPQVVLGLTFNWGALVGWSAVEGSLSLPAYCIYFAGLFWTLGYDTIYAHQDKEDDVLVGIKSTALRLGEKTVPALWVFYGLTILLIGLAGYFAQVSMLFYLGLGATALHLIWQIFKVDIHDPQNCLIIFKSNKYFGWILLAACLLGNVSP